MNTRVQRHQTVAVTIDDVMVGGDAPVVVQSMTNTDTADVEATTQQIVELSRAGSELVRITVNNADSAEAVPRIRDGLDALGINTPLIGDFHFNGHRLLQDTPACAQALSKYRINPGNVGSGERRDEQFAAMIEQAIRYNKAVRIGVNWGSLDKALVARMMDQNSTASQPKDADEMMREIMVASALESATRAEEVGLERNRIILSCKMSRVQDLVAVYRLLARRSDHVLHLGLTEAGMGTKGVVASTAALSLLLHEGIGDTIRISLTPEPDGDRCQEVRVAQEILQALELRAFIPQVIACPGCGRTTSTYFQQLAQDIQSFLREQMPIWKQSYPGVEKMNVAVMGCIVNGPGESKHADIGISLPGTGERPAAPVYIDGEKSVTLKGDNIGNEFKRIVGNYVEQRFG